MSWGRWLAFVAVTSGCSAYSPSASDAGPTPVADGGDAGNDAGDDPAPCPDLTCGRVVFITSATSLGRIDGLAGADALCAKATINVPALSGRVFLAWLSVAGTAPRNRFNASERPVIGTDGQRIAPGGLKVKLVAPIRLDENRGVIEGVEVWSATDTFGGYVGPDCNGWSDADPKLKGRFGRSGRMDPTWVSSGEQTCDQPAHVYCLEQ
jgi:hypothetical protein